MFRALQRLRRPTVFTPSAQRSAGFTIVEVMIVLAVGGLFLLIVFEAIPALERASHNNQRKQDVNLILQAVSHYQLDDSGTFPLACGPSPGCGSKDTTDTDRPNDYFLQFVAPKLTYYTGANQVVLDPLSASTGPKTGTNPDANTEAVYIYNYQICDPDNPGQSTGRGADYTDVVALYALETGGTPSSQCQAL